MIQRVWGGANNPDVHSAISQWVSLHSFGHRDNVWPDSSSYGVMRDGVPIAGVIYHDYKPSAGTVQYSGAATDRSWLKGPSLHLMFSYMFDDLGCQMVLTGNSSENTGLHRLLEVLDHKKHVIERGWGRDEDLYLWTLTKENWLANGLMVRSKKWHKESENV
ncbi:head assembly protein [Sulfitobacter phage phiGT1]|nr:head assembly protein [Sulfitobacter phage phiGT1]